MSRVNALLVCLLVTDSLACARGVLVREQGKRPGTAHLLALAPTQLMYLREGVPATETFLKGDGVGFFKQSGGYVVDEKTGFVYSKKVDVEDAQGYGDHVIEWLDGELHDALSADGVKIVAADAAVAQSVPLPKRIEQLAISTEGDDNVNMPHFDVRPAASAPELVGKLPAGADALLVPLVIYYYAHNGGWFVGQEWGCPSGARFRVVWILYDANGNELGSADIDAKDLKHGRFQPDVIAVQALRASVEARMKTALERTLD